MVDDARLAGTGLVFSCGLVGGIWMAVKEKEGGFWWGKFVFLPFGYNWGGLVCIMLSTRVTLKS